MRFDFKKIILIIIFILIAIGFGFGLYYLFFRPISKEPLPEAGKEIVSPGILPPAGEGTGGIIVVPPSGESPEITPSLPVASDIAAGGETLVKSVIKEVVSSPILNKNTGEVFYYDKDKNEFYKINADGKRELLSERKFYQVENINWSPDKNKAILEYPDGNKILYDFEKDKQITLNKNWYDFSFSSSGNEIGLKIDSDDPNNRWLAKANADGTGLKMIEPLGENAQKVQVAWSPNNQVVAFSATGEDMGFDKQEILFIGFYGENFKSIVVEGRGFEGKWSPQGNKIIYSVWNADSGYRPTLWAVEAEGDNIGRGRKELDLQTWADKCVFSSDNKNIYCAAPKYLPEGAGLAPEIADRGDNFYKINLDRGVKTFLAEPSVGEYNVSDIFLSAEEDFLYFTDQNTGQLNKIQLK
ncbi:MAG: Uncharacterized protein Athens101410_117 [Parcubacteria group bacterium Athens1014_10]|nr:MAG: Uncharacterized protein Athens101410_117 [Parcubacteria group bacterium Athens1014_10]TSD05914.1 MAG: Uncharacterized protein Athens071412_196 [Parcubacteria group bacterium Athens0714_12]